jgi:hypothetical protein
MATLSVWDLFHLYRYQMMIRSVLFLLLNVVVTANLFAQQRWGGGVDNETLHFGFKFQYVSAEYKIFKREEWREQLLDPNRVPYIASPLTSISSTPTAGFALGFVSDLKLTEHTNLRFTPGLVFSDVVTNFRFQDSTMNVDKKVESTFVDLPLSFKFKSNRVNNYRAYLIAGPKYSMDIVSKKKRMEDSGKYGAGKKPQTVPNALWYEVGVGLDIYFEWFKLSPEIKFAQTFKSVLQDKDRVENPYTSPIDKMFLRNFQFSLYFE